MGRGGHATAQPRRASSVVISTDFEVWLEDQSAGMDGIESSVHTVYLIRHGEAEHNVKEKAAQRVAQADAVARGMHPDKVKAAMEAARTAVLHDDSMHDPPLSDAGKASASHIRMQLEELTSKGLPAPSRVLVSPLQRTLQTAALAFPSHANLQAREELRERQTGLACDTCSPLPALAQRETFDAVDFDKMLQIGGVGADGEQDGATKSSLTDVEDKAMLRIRTMQVLTLLEETADRSVALVTHKGFLRELERGPLCKPDASECSNAEVRVYTLSISREEGGNRRLVAERIA